MPVITIDYFTDILCIWAYIAQRRIDELEQEFGSQVKVISQFFPVFGNTKKKMATQWQTRGGFEGYAHHVQTIAKSFDHTSLHPDVWSSNAPSSSLQSHLYLAAIKSLVMDDQCDHTSIAKAAGLLREAFFCHAQNIADANILDHILEKNNFDIASIKTKILNGEAFAVMSEDMKMAMELNVRSSPTMIFNEDRQRLSGNVGYKIIQANIRELIDSPNKQQSWC